MSAVRVFEAAVVLGGVLSFGGCGAGASADDGTARSGAPSGTAPSLVGSGSSGSMSLGEGPPPASSGSSSAGDAATANDEASSGDDGSPPTPDASSPACAMGQVTPDQIIMIGDSYLDYPAWSNVAPDIMADARNAGSLAMNASYRQYQLGGAAMNYGVFNLNVPYQFETSAMNDSRVALPKDIRVVIMDGGGNDVLIDNRGCLTGSVPPPGNSDCATAIHGTIDRARRLLMEAASDGVKQIVYFFYPHLDPAGGGILPTPAPQVNATLDYAYPLAEQVCCGSSFASSASSYTCSGNTTGAQCVFVDTRPAFEGHIAEYIKDDHVHPTPAGSRVIADLVWAAMQKYCVAQ